MSDVIPNTAPPSTVFVVIEVGDNGDIRVESVVRDAEVAAALRDSPYAVHISGGQCWKRYVIECPII